jgi:hypothetical protein
MSARVDGGARQVIDELLNAARVALDMELAFLSHIEGDEQHFEYVFGTPRSLRLEKGARVPAAGAYCALMLRGEIPHVVTDVRGHRVLGPMPVTSSIGARSCCGVPVHLPDGQLYGTLCGLDSEIRTDLSDDQVTVLSVISSLLSHQLAALLTEQRVAEIRRQSLLSLIEPGALTMVAQPIVDVAGERVAGYEALARFTRTDAGRPGADLVFAEAELGLGEAFEQAALAAALELLPRLPVDAYLSVSLSAASLTSAVVVEQLAAAPLSRLVLELTEHEAVEDYECTSPGAPCSPPSSASRRSSASGWWVRGWRPPRSGTCCRRWPSRCCRATCSAVLRPFPTAETCSRGSSTRRAGAPADEGMLAGVYGQAPGSVRPWLSNSCRAHAATAA